MMQTVPPRMPSPSARRLPEGTCDCHTHVLGPFEQLPFAYPPAYDPPLAPCDVYLQMLTLAGFSRGVVVQPTTYGIDVRALLDALHKGRGRLRGIGAATSQTSDGELAAMHAAGVRGLRFVAMQNPKTGQAYPGAVGLDQLSALAPRMKELGWHAQIWATSAQLAEALPEWARLDVGLALDHMGGFDVTRGVSSPEFQQIVDLLKEGRIWVKLSLCRNSRAFPDYPDVRPFHDALIAANPDRLLWGSDWPFVRMGDLTPDVSHLLSLFYQWVEDDTLRSRILVANPAHLFGWS